MRQLTRNPRTVLSFFLFFAICAIMFAIGAGESLAHKINVFAVVEKNSLVVEGYFPATSRLKILQLKFTIHQGIK